MRKTAIIIAVAALVGLTGVAQASSTSVAGASANQTAGANNAGNAQSLTQNAADGVEYSGSYKLKNVPNVTAPGLTTTLTETCMGSSSAGGAIAGFGITFGTTWRDGACVRRLDSRHMKDLGYNLAAKELMCDSKKVRAALLRAGRPCFEDLPGDVQASILSERATPAAPTPVATEGELINPASAVGALNQ